MDEGHETAARAGPRALVHEPDAARAETGQGRREVVDPQGDVMDAGPAAFYRSGDRRALRGRLQELQRGLAHGHEPRADLLGRHLFDLADLQPQRVPVEGQRLVEAADRDSDVIQRRLHPTRSPFDAGSGAPADAPPRTARSSIRSAAA